MFHNSKEFCNYNNFPVSKNSYWSNIDAENAEQGDKIIVLGYPGKNEVNLYEMDGNNKDINNAKNNP